MVWWFGWGGSARDRDRDTPKKTQKSEYRDIITYVQVEPGWKCRTIIPDTTLSVAQAKDIVIKNRTILKRGFDLLILSHDRRYSQYDTRNHTVPVYLVDWQNMRITYTKILAPIRFSDNTNDKTI